MRHKRIMKSAGTEKRARIVADAVESRAEALESGKGYAAGDAHAWLPAKAQGDRMVRKPKAKPWRK